VSAILAVMIHTCTNAILNTGVADVAKREQVPGEFLIGVFLLILICFAFGGFFTPSETR